jgi:hypothetical protein
MLSANEVGIPTSLADGQHNCEYSIKTPDDGQ